MLEKLPEVGIIPEHIKNILTLTGYASVSLLRQLTNIDEIEEYVRNKMPTICEHSREFYGSFSDLIDEFEFSPGERKLIQNIVNVTNNQFKTLNDDIMKCKKSNCTSPLELNNVPALKRNVEIESKISTLLKKYYNKDSMKELNIDCSKFEVIVPENALKKCGMIKCPICKTSVKILISPRIIITNFIVHYHKHTSEGTNSISTKKKKNQPSILKYFKNINSTEPPTSPAEVGSEEEWELL